MDKLHIIPRHHTVDDEVKDSVSPKSISKRFLVNKLNYLNFQDRTILVNFKHKRYATTLSLKATPLPCAGDHLECVWAETADPGVFNSHTFDNLFITDDKKCLLVKPVVININEQGISLLLPETCSELRDRKMKRLTSTGIRVMISQNSAILKGTLLDSSSTSFRAQVITDSPHVFQWINFEVPVSVHLHAGQELLFSGDCMITKRSLEQSAAVFVLATVNDRIQRYKPKQFRSSRYALIPSPSIVFVHPFTGKKVQLKTIDLSGSGFSVEESLENSVLFAGIIIPELELIFAHSFRINCRAQVIYRNTSGNGEKEGVVKCGLAIIDMAMDDHVKLSSLLHQVDNRNSYVCTSVDMDALWNFFFETGFIYPEKYAFFQVNKVEIKRIYEKLYNHNPEIARHFIHQEKGAILGHLSMVRFYEDSWLVHHHAASKTESIKAGIIVLKQISNYMNDLHHLQSAHLKYLFSYFRPENKFPNRVFGGFARELNDSRGCSLDKFAYFHFKQTKQNQALLHEPWTLTDARPKDLSELKNYYGHASNGLMLDAFDLMPGIVQTDVLAKEFQRLGFKKKKRLYSLLEGGELKAMILANITDIGLNMANLSNCVTVIVIDETMPRYFIEAALSQVVAEYEHQEMPVLMYPVSYAESSFTPFEKTYTLWILNLEYLDPYFKFCDRFFSALKKSS